MSILLKDEGIAEIVGLRKPDINFENANAIAKAQLKKVKEHPDCWYDTVCGKRVLCVPESLLEEVKE